jgi:hypothetical protein
MTVRYRRVLSPSKALSVMRAHIGGRKMVSRPCDTVLWEAADRLSDEELLSLLGPKIGTKEEVLVALNKAIPFYLCD